MGDYGGGDFHSLSKIMLSFRMQTLRQKSGIRRPGFNSASRALLSTECSELHQEARPTADVHVVTEQLLKTVVLCNYDSL
jgi:hypothetical protein